MTTNNNGSAEDGTQATHSCKIVNNILIGEELVFPDEPLNSGEVILNILKSKPEFVGQIDARTGNQTTYAEMRERSVKCAVWLKKQGIQPGDIISVCLDNHLNTFAPFLACLYVGAICAPGDHDMTAYTARNHLSLLEPKMVFLHSDSVRIVKDAAKALNINIKMVIFEDGPHEREEEALNEILAKQTSAEVEEFRCAKIKEQRDTAMIVSTSGTTGLPKGTKLSHLSMKTMLHPCYTAAMQNRVSLWPPTLRWVFGIVKTLKALRACSTRIIISSDDQVEVYCQIIEKYKVEFLGTEPSMLKQFIKYELYKKYCLTSLKVVVVAGSCFKAEQQEKIAQLMPHASILQLYGTTDAGSGFIRQTRGSRMGSCGFVLKGARVKIVDISTGEALGPNKRGELCVKTAAMMNGYHNNPEASKSVFDSEGWMHTGDIAYYTENGEIFVVDRISEFIIYRGHSLSAAEIECVLEKHPAVSKAAVIPLYIEIEGEVPLAIVSKLPGKEVTEQELKDHVDEYLQEYCGIRGGVIFVDNIPRTTTGKIAKGELRKMFSGRPK